VIPALLVAIIGLGVLAWVTLPLRGGRSEDAPELSRALEEALADKRAALMAIVDIENERAVGKMSQADFDALKAEYESQALAALRNADALRASATGSAHEPEDDDELELEIAAVRERLRCPNCGAARTPGKACEQCGK
jgi:hypothetical protein